MRCLFSIILTLHAVAASTAAESYRSQNSGVRPPEEILSELDGLIDHAGDYTALRIRKADSLKRLSRAIPLSRDKLETTYELAIAQSGFSCDSAISTLNRGIEMSLQLNDSVMAQRFSIRRARELLLIGQQADAIAEFRKAAAGGLLAPNEEMYHSTGRIIFYTINTLNYFQNVDPGNRMESEIHARKQMALLTSDTVAYDVAEALIHMGNGNSAEMLAALYKALEKVRPGDEEYHIVTILLGEYYRAIGSPDEAIYYYALSAMENIRETNLYEVAILRLGEQLYAIGDKVRAIRYLSMALEQAIESNARFNLMRLNKAFIDVAHEQQAERRSRIYMLTLIVALMAVILTIVTFMVISKRRQLKSMRATERRLERVNLAKNTYISEFMNLCASYMESLEEYNRLCKRKITAGQTDDLLTYIRSEAVLEEQRKKFYDVFDEAFLLLFPDFVADVNALLQPDRRIVTPSPTVLTTELRILALTRLGIEDSAMISRFLGISTNTIYTYRNKLRTRAVDRSTIDNDIKQIGAV